jgi:hypothetical protein
MTIEVAAPVSEFLSFDRTTAGVKATGSITFLTGGTDTDTITVLDSKKSLVFESLEDVGAPTSASNRAVPLFTTTWELQDYLIPLIEAAFDLVATEANVGAEATVTFTTDDPTDGAIVTVTDALGNAISFEFSDAGDGTTGDVQVTNGADHVETATAFAAAVNTAFADLGGTGVDTITAADDEAGVITLTGNPIYGKETQVASDPEATVVDANIAVAVWGNSSLADGLTKTNLEATYKGTSGNETLLESGNTYTVAGMASGTNAATTVGMNDTVGTPEFTMTRYKDGRIEFLDAAGVKVIAHSSDEACQRLFAALKAVVAA